jgi:shikimate kinase
MSLLLSTVLCAGVLLYIFLPRPKLRTLTAKSTAEQLVEKRDVLYDNLRDLTFEVKAGKYLEVDYAVQRNSLEQEAAAVVDEIRAAESTRPLS